MRTVRLIRLLTAVLLLVMLTGCTFGATVDSLLKPPRLQGEQEQIYQALQNAVGKNITLQYPRTGEHLSAVVVADFDNDTLDEAVVFYRKGGTPSAENALRLNMLDQMNGEWMSVCDLPAEGAEVERVMVSSLGRKQRLIVGYSVVDQSDRALVVYDYAENSLLKNFTVSYSNFAVTDLDGNQQKELLILHAAESDRSAEAAVYVPDALDNYTRYSLTLRCKMTECSQILCGAAPNGSIAIYLDVIVGATTMQTEILHFDGSRLAYFSSSDSETVNTTRPVGWLTMDIDEDGVPEVPVQDVFPGYTETSSDLIRMTRWMTIAENQMLVEKYRGYYSLAEGYAFMLPPEWIDTVTVRNDPLTGDLVFCRYTGSLSGTLTELMRIGAAEDAAVRDSRLEEGYQLLYSRGNAFYFAKVIPSEDTLYRSIGDLLGYFMFV